MSSRQSDTAPPEARDPDAYAEDLHAGPMRGMDMADHALRWQLLLDKLEYVATGSDSTQRLDAAAWFGGDINKLWLKLDGEREHGRLGATRTEALWNHAFARHWSTQVGTRWDFGEDPGRGWLALGVQGLAPYWFNVEATAYVGESGRTAARLEAEYDVLLTQRLILQANVALNLYGKNDPPREIGSGLSDAEFGLRLRYEIRRQLAPYIGIAWQRKFGNTADFARTAGADTHATQLVLGVRMWF